jgi:hypothetical protein
MVLDPNREDFERYLLASLIDEMNNLFLLSLAMDFVCDRFLEEEVFDKIMNSMVLGSCTRRHQPTQEPGQVLQCCRVAGL